MARTRRREERRVGTRAQAQHAAGDSSHGHYPPPRRPVTHWSRIGRALSALAVTTEGDPARWAAFERLVEGLTSPIRLLEHLAMAADRVDLGDEARAEFVQVLSDVSRIVGPYHPDRPTVGHPAPCGCDSDSANRVAPRTRLDAGDTQGILDEQVVSDVLVTAAAIAMSPSSGLHLETATSTIVQLALGATLLADLVHAYEQAGRDGLLEVLDRARLAGDLHWVSQSLPPTMRTLSGGGPGMPSMPGLPGRPGLPGVPGLPGGPPLGDGDFEDLVADLLKWTRPPRRWDPEKYDHRYPWWRDGIEIIDRRTIDFIRCVREVNRLLLALQEPPPVRPAEVVWTTGITQVTLAGACAGGVLTIIGTGFGATQPPGVALLLPTLDGCRVVVPTLWTDTRIEAVLPATVASGPVGFGDALYIAAYDAWAARMNGLEADLSRLRCAPRPRRFVAPFGDCPPARVFNEITAGVPVIRAFTANFEVEHALEAGQPLTLRWDVANAATVRIERLSFGGPALTGPSFGGAAVLTPPGWQRAYAFGAQFHTSAGEWQYRLTVTGACGPAVSRLVRIFLVKRPGIRIDRIQVTQSIQTADHAVRLVTAKPTVVRVLVQHGLAGWNGGRVTGVTGRIRGLVNGGWTPWIDAANNTSPMAPLPGASITVPPSPAFDNTNDTLNFILPTGWCTGTARYQVEARVTGFAAWGPYPGFSEVVSAWSPIVTYAPRRTLQFRYVRVNWNGTGAPTHQVCRDTLTGAVPMLPTPTAGIAAVPGQGVHARSSATTAQENSERRDMLNDFDDLHNCSWWEAATEWLGSDCPDDDGAIWVLIPSGFRRGEAYDIPSNVCYTPPSDGPYAAHEIAHCLDQAHVRLPIGPNGPGGGDAASAWPNNGLLVDVPFDVSGTPGATTPRALSLQVNNGAGVGVGDLMTYWGTQNGTWPMPRRWQQLWDVIGA